VLQCLETGLIVISLTDSDPSLKLNHGSVCIKTGCKFYDSSYFTDARLLNVGLHNYCKCVWMWMLRNYLLA